MPVDVAIEECRQRLEDPQADPRWVIPWSFILWRQGDYTSAHQVASRFHSALQNDPDFLLLYGMISRQLPECLVEAEAAFHAAIRIAPDRHDAYYNLGNLYFHLERFEDALVEYRRSLDLDSKGALVWLNFGLAARSCDQLTVSYNALSRCLQLDPNDKRAWCNFGITCHQLERFDQAIQAYQHALSLDENDGPTLVNLAMSLNATNRHPESVGYLQAASSLTLQEDCGDALFNLALTRLLLGDYRRGWELYECRFKTRQYVEYTKIPEGVWVQSQDELYSLAKRKSELLVWSEQGLGDSIQFVRYLFLLLSLGIRPVLATRPLLVRLFQEWLPIDVDVIDDHDVDITADSRPHTAMMSLPHLFGTLCETVPSVLPYLRPPGPPPEALLVSPPAGGLSIGVVWASNPDNNLMYRRKSLPFSCFIEPLIPALREDLLELHCLQVGQDAAVLSRYEHVSNLHDWNGRLGDFSDTAHVVRQLDLVISVDTGVAHLAGALGIPTWLLLHYDADFRWLRNCDDSPWYPGMRLFRQQRYGDWSTVMRPVLDALGRVYGLDLQALQ